MYSLKLNTENNNATTAKIVMGNKAAMDFTNIIKNLPENITSVELNMSRLELINSAGLGTIVQAHNELKKRNIDLLLSGVNPNILRLLNVTHLDKIFKIIS